METNVNNLKKLAVKFRCADAVENVEGQTLAEVIDFMQENYPQVEEKHLYENVFYQYDEDYVIAFAYVYDTKIINDVSEIKIGHYPASGVVIINNNSIISSVGVDECGDIIYNNIKGGLEVANLTYLSSRQIF